jgi:hypothetical protein
MRYTLQSILNVNSESTLLIGLVSVWELDETSGGTIYDAHGSNNGTIVGNPTLGETGKINTAISFDGNDYANLSHPTVSEGDISISFWVKPTTLADYDFVVSDYVSNYGWDIGVMANGSIVVTFRDGSAVDGFSDAGLLSNGTWAHVVVIQDGATGYVDIYVDNDLKNTLTTQHIFSYSGSEAPKIGGRQSFNCVNAVIDQVALWSKKLTLTEIGILNNSGNGLAYINW